MAGDDDAEFGKFRNHVSFPDNFSKQRFGGKERMAKSVVLAGRE
jgi:hypothetical protein